MMKGEGGQSGLNLFIRDPHVNDDLFSEMSQIDLNRCPCFGKGDALELTASGGDIDSSYIPFRRINDFPLKSIPASIR